VTFALALARRLPYAEGEARDFGAFARGAVARREALRGWLAGAAGAVRAGLGGDGGPRLCAVVVSVPREPDTVLTTAASLARGLLGPTSGPAAGWGAALVVHDASRAHAGARPELEELAQHGVAVERPPVNESFEAALACQPLCARFARELRDYISSARLCLQRKSTTHVLLVQDDALAGEALLERLVPAVEAADAEARDRARPWLYIKLFRTGFYAGWSSEPGRIAELLAGSALMALACLAGFRAVDQDASEAALRMMLVFGVAMASIKILGRQNTWGSLFAPAPGLVPEDDGDGAVAMLFPRSPLQAMIDFAASPGVRRTEVDLFINDYQHAAGLTGHTLRPNLFEHIGLMSSLKPASDIERWYAHGFKESEWFEERPAGPLARAGRQYAPLTALVLALALWHLWAYGAASVACRGGAGARPAVRRRDRDHDLGGDDDDEEEVVRLELRP
jgi:hypothetical protein